MKIHDRPSGAPDTFPLERFRNIVVLTGAGISAESGLSTFRDSDGLWEKHRVEDVATPEAFAQDPKLVWRFYSARRRAAQAARPNAAHEALARFSRVWATPASGRRFLLVTQNVDGLHERCHRQQGAELPLAMHGTLDRSRCSGCGHVVPDELSYFDTAGNPTQSPERTTSEGLPLSPCCGTLLRPHIVWFGEMPLHMDEIEPELAACDLFVTIGTSGNVYPAAGFLHLAQARGATTVCLNREPLPQASAIDHFVQGNATETVPRFFRLPEQGASR